MGVEEMKPYLFHLLISNGVDLSIKLINLWLRDEYMSKTDKLMMEKNLAILLNVDKVEILMILDVNNP